MQKRKDIEGNFKSIQKEGPAKFTSTDGKVIEKLGGFKVRKKGKGKESQYYKAITESVGYKVIINGGFASAKSEYIALRALARFDADTPDAYSLGYCEMAGGGKLPAIKIQHIELPTLRSNSSVISRGKLKYALEKFIPQLEATNTSWDETPENILTDGTSVKFIDVKAGRKGQLGFSGNNEDYIEDILTHHLNKPIKKKPKDVVSSGESEDYQVENLGDGVERLVF